jgi:hypothetical protein
MTVGDWVQGPFGVDALKGRTIRCQRTVLVVVHSITTATRLMDIVPLVESDRRVQVVYTWAPSSIFGAGVNEFLAKLGAAVVPWRQATHTRFDLVIAASQGGLEQLSAPVLTVPHGAGFSKYPSVWPGHGPRARQQLGEADPWRLVYHGRVVASGIIVATTHQLQQLRLACPEAAAVATVAGDPCLDRLVASLPLRGDYRKALGTGERTLVAVSSTWGPGSLLDQHPDLLSRLVAELDPAGYQVAAITHPNVWHWHSPRQVTSWFAESVRNGLVFVPPEDSWRAVLASADVVIGDHGSVTCYAAAAGVPVMLAAFPPGEVDPRSQVAWLAGAAPRLQPGQPIAAQLDQAAAVWSPALHAAARARVTSAPGQAAGLIQRVIYQLMGLTQPPEPPAVLPVAAHMSTAGRSPAGVSW